MEKKQLERMGQLVRIARIEAGDMTQSQLAERLGVSVATVSDYERAIRRRLSRAEVLALEEALGIEDRRLMITVGYDPPPDPDGNVLHYPGPPLTAKQREDTLCFIDWLRNRSDDEDAG